MPGSEARTNPVRDLIVTLIIFTSLPAILARPHIGVLVWSWLGYMNPHRLTWGFAYNFPFSKIVAATLFVSLLFSPEKKRIPLTPLTIVWLAFIGWMLVTTANAMYPEAAKEMLARTLKIQLVVFVTIMVMRSRLRLDQLVWVIVFSLGFFGVKGGIFALLKGGHVLLYGPGGFIEDNNALAIGLVMTLPLCNYLRLTTTSKPIRWFLVASMILISVAVVATFSRAAMLGGLAMAVMIWWKSKDRFATALGVLVVLPFLYFWAPDSWHERMATITTPSEETGERDKSSQSRLYIWGMILNLAEDRPILGAGMEPWHENTYALYADDPTKIAKAWSAHSIYFSVLAEHGYPGLLMFLTIFFLALRGGGKAAKQCEGLQGAEWLALLLRMLQVSLVGYLVAGAFHQIPYFDLPWHLVGIIAIGQALAREYVGGEATVDGLDADASRPVGRTPAPA